MLDLNVRNLSIWTLFNFVSTVLVFAAAALRLSLDDQLFPGMRPNTARTPEDWFDSNFERSSGDQLQSCGWSPRIEVLRFLLAFLLCLLCLRCGEIFFLAPDSKLGILTL